MDTESILYSLLRTNIDIYLKIRNYVIDNHFYFRSLVELYQPKRFYKRFYWIVFHSILREYQNNIDYKLVWDRIGEAIVLYGLPSLGNLHQQLIPSQNYIVKTMKYNKTYLTSIYRHIARNELYKPKTQFLSKILINTPFVFGTIKVTCNVYNSQCIIYSDLVELTNPTILQLFRLVDITYSLNMFNSCYKFKQYELPPSLKNENIWNLTYYLDKYKYRKDQYQLSQTIFVKNVKHSKGGMYYVSKQFRYLITNYD